MTIINVTTTKFQQIPYASIDFKKKKKKYTWCRSNKGPQNGWLHRIGKVGTDKCRCGTVMTGTHVVEECPRVGEVGGGPRGTGKKEKGKRRGRGLNKQRGGKHDRRVLSNSVKPTLSLFFFLSQYSHAG